MPITALETFAQDLRYGFRIVRRNPGFAAVAVLSLAIGIGANSAVFSVADALLLRPMPVANPHELALFKRLGPNGEPQYTFLYRWYDRLRAQPATFSDVSGSLVFDRYNVSGNPERVSVALATGNYFRTLGAGAQAGRTFATGEERVAVISDRFWERRFARTPDAIGRTLQLHDASYTIIGVMPRGFTGEWVGRPADMWIPFAMASQAMPEVPGGPEKFSAVMFGRLRPGVSLAHAEAASQAVFRQMLLEDAGPSATAFQLQFASGRRFELESGARGYGEHRAAFASPFGILMAATGLVLLIACANIANLLLARSAARQREIAVRLAIGAGRGRLMRQLLTEGLVLASLGAAAGLLFSGWAAQALAAMIASGTATVAPIELAATIDVRVLGFTALVTLAAALVFGLAPALRAPRGIVPGRRFTLGKSLVVSQVALTVVLLFGAGLLVRTLRNLSTQDLGFARDHLLLVWMSPMQTGRAGETLAPLAETVRARVATLPGVRSASISNGGMLEGGTNYGAPSEYTLAEGQPPRPGLRLRLFAIAPQFFTTTGIPLLAGRDLDERDTETSPKVGVINETMARFYFGNKNPVGRRFGGPRGTETEIVGVVGNSRAGSPRDARGMWYVPYRQMARVLRMPWCLVVRTTGEPGSVAQMLRGELRRIDASVPVLRINTVDEQVDDALAQERMIAALCSFFGVVAVLLASVGLFGVVSYTAARRTREIGIRMAVGSTPAGVVRLLVRESLLLVAVGLAAGAPVAMIAGRWIGTRLFGVSPADPLTAVGVVGLLMAVASVAAVLPARRAARIDPMSALRGD